MSDPRRERQIEAVQKVLIQGEYGKIGIRRYEAEWILDALAALESAERRPGTACDGPWQATPIEEV